MEGVARPLLVTSIAAAISFTNINFNFSNWPAFVPVHDPSRKAYIGIQNMGTVFTRRFEADRIGSQVPIRLMHLEGLHELFLSKFVSLLFSLLLLFFHKTLLDRSRNQSVPQLSLSLLSLVVAWKQVTPHASLCF